MKIAFLAAANSPHTIKWANAFAENNDVAVISLPEDKDNFGELSEKVSVTYLDVPASQGGFKKNAAQVKSVLASGGFGVVNAFGATTYGVLAAKAKAPNTVLTVLGPDIYASVDLGKKGPCVQKLQARGRHHCCRSQYGDAFKTAFQKGKKLFRRSFRRRPYCLFQRKTAAEKRMRFALVP